MTMLLVGVVAGALTTVSGAGGGVLLVMTLAVLTDARHALVVTALALLVGNLHRLWLYRRDLTRAVTVPLIAGIAPGSLIGALLAVTVPELLIQGLMLLITGLTLARALSSWSWTVPVRALPPSGAVVGLLAATAGGAGLLIAPLLQATGLSGRRYLATVAAAAVAMHSIRILGYGVGGLIDGEVLREAAALAVALVVGNLLGDAVRHRIPEPTQRAIELGTPVICIGLAVAGMS